MNTEEVETYSSPIRAASDSSLLLDSAFLIFLRIVYFVLSRRFLLSTLNPTLREISQPEIILPVPVASESRAAPARPEASTTGNDLEDADTEDDALLSYTTPVPSYPPSPVRVTLALPAASRSAREPFIRRISDDPPRSTLPSHPEPGSFELGNLSQKLRLNGAAEQNVHTIQLSHGKSTGTKGTKKATRGLSRAAR
jgi:hypothetical protein